MRYARRLIVWPQAADADALLILTDWKEFAQTWI